MIFTILTFRALGRTHIASKPCVAIAMLCFDSTVGFPWSVPVLKQQLTAGGVFLTHASLSVPSNAPPTRGSTHPARDRGLRAAPKGEPSAAIHTGVNPSFSPHTSQYSLLHQKKPSAPAFGSKPSLTLRWALSQALPRQYSTRLTPGAGFGPSLTPTLAGRSSRGSPHRGSGAGPFLSRLVFRPWLGQPPALLSEPLLLPKLRS